MQEGRGRPEVYRDQLGRAKQEKPSVVPRSKRVVPRTVTPRARQTETGLGQLPPDTLRYTAKYLPLREIVRLCRVNKQFRQTLCEDITFWRDLAHERGVSFTPRTTLDELKREVLNLVAKRKVVDIFELVRPDAEDTHVEYPGFDYSIDYLHQQYGGNIPLPEALQAFLEVYNNFFDIEQTADFISLEEFSNIISNLQNNVHEFDIFDFGSSKYFVYKHPTHGLLLKSIHEEIFIDEKGRTGYAFLPPEVAPILRELYYEKQRPLTLHDIRGIYPRTQTEFTEYGVEYDGKYYTLLDDNADPSLIYDIPMLVKYYGEVEDDNVTDDDDDDNNDDDNNDDDNNNDNGDEDADVTDDDDE